MTKAKIALLALLISFSVHASNLSFQDTPIQQVAKVVSELTNKNIIVPSDVDQSINLYAPNTVSETELLELFYSAVQLAGFDYEVQGRNIFLKTKGSSLQYNQSKFRNYSFDVELPSSLLSLLPDGSRLFSSEGVSVVYTSPEYYSTLLTIKRSIQDQKFQTRVFNVSNINPDKLASLSSDTLTIIPFSDLKRISATGTAAQLDNLQDQILKLDASINLYQVDLVIVSAGQTFINEYSLDLTAVLDFFTFGVAGQIRSSLDTSVNNKSSVSGLLTWLKQNRDIQIIQKPNLAVLDGKTSSILVGQEVPFQTTQYNPESDTQQVITTERKNVGLQVNISVQTLNNGLIRLDLDQELSSISQTQLDQSIDIITDKQSLKTTIDMHPNRFYMVGGLQYKDSVLNTSAPPVFDTTDNEFSILEDVFTNETKSSSTRNLVIFIQLKPLNILTN
nr:hypothetical protein 11 [Piscirickettsiaceae bacterium]